MTTNKCNLYIYQLQKAFNEEQYTKVLEQVDTAIDLCKSNNERFLVAKLYDIKIDCYVMIGIPARAHETLTEFHTFIEHYGTIESTIWFHLCAVNLWENGSSAVDTIVYRHIQQALLFGAKTSDPNLKRRVYGTMSKYLTNIGEYESACDYLEMAFFYAQLVVEQDPEQESLIYSTVIDLIYLNTILERYDIAKSINAFVYPNIDQLSGYQKGVIIQNYGYLLMKQRKFEKAIDQFQILAAYTDDFKDTSLKAIAYQYMCECMEEINHPDLIPMFKMQVKVLNDLLDERETEYALEAELKIQQNRFWRNVSIDALTGVYNRSFFEEEAQKILSQLDGSTYVLVAMIDLDYFKQLNDTYGHLVGDDALITVGAGLKTFALQLKAIGARFGGDEFLLICPNKDRQRLINFAQNVHKGLSSLSVETEQQIIPLSFSMGVTIVNESLNLKDVLQQADEALYKVKSNGRGHIAFYNEITV